MILLMHVLIAFSSMLYALYLFLRPTTTRFHIMYVLVASTIASGTYLILIMPAHMVRACIAGFFYLSIVFAAIAAAKSKLASEEVKIK